jgi:hypothetical protein
MSVKDVSYLLAYYARDLMAMAALGASIMLLIMGFFHASRGLALRKTATSIILFALAAGTAPQPHPIAGDLDHAGLIGAGDSHVPVGQPG